MALYMWTGSYTTDAIRGMVDDPQDREAFERAAVESLGGKLHHFLFSFGNSDIIAFMEFDDDVDMVALSMLVAANGAFSHGATTKLLTSADAMAVMARAKEARGSYSPPSG